MSYIFFPGCSLDGTAGDYNRSAMAVAGKLGLELPELKNWICCGSTTAHNSDPILAYALPAMNLSAAAGKTAAVVCAACYNRLKTANHHIAGDTAVRARVAELIGSNYDGQTPVLHLLEILCREIGFTRIRAAIRRPLTGLKIACYYGCLLSHPPNIANFDDAENPKLMDDLMEAAGATAIHWQHKTESCGDSCSITDSSKVLQLGNEILAMAKAAGADCMVTACPRCQLNLDMRQNDIEAKYNRQYGLPVFYFTQLLGLAMGCSARELSLGNLVVDPRALLESKGIRLGSFAANVGT